MSEKPALFFCLLISVLSITAFLIAHFNDNISYSIGKFILSWDMIGLKNEPYLGKIVPFSWLIFAPTFFIILNEYFSYKRSRFLKFLKVMSYIIVGVLTILFYIYSNPYFAQFNKEETGDSISRFLCDFKDIYIWYALPVFNFLVPITLSIMFKKIGNRPFVYLFFGILVVGLIGILLPLSIGFLGAIIALAIAVAIIIFGLFFVGKIGEMIPSPPPPSKYRLDNGTEVTEIYHGRYTDGNGNYYTSYDGGHTFEKD